jgi:prepilin-type N-terminal cleavage/methylation domain-containing protein
VTPRCQEHRECGFTLIEVLVGLVVLAIISLALISLLSTSTHLGQLAQERTAATALASERIHRIMSRPMLSASDFALYEMPDETAATGPPATLTSDYGEIVDHPDFKRVVVFNYDTPAPGMLAIETTVSWLHFGQGERSHVMVAYLHPALD